MLTLTPMPQNLQMDWTSLDPKIEIKTNSTDEDKNSSVARTDIEKAVSRHFEESLKKVQSQNGFHSENSTLVNTFVPFSRQLDAKPWGTQPNPAEETIMPPHGYNNDNTNSKSNNPQASCSEAGVETPNSSTQTTEITSTTTTSAGPYDVDAINTILKTIQYNCFIKSSILKSEIKDEEIKMEKEAELNSTHTNGQGIPVSKCTPLLVGGNGNGQKHETPLPTVNSGVDIVAELPCSSNGNWKNLIKHNIPLPTHEANDDVDIESELPCTAHENWQNLVKPPSSTVNTEVDIEAELPSTSIQQKRKPARSRKKEVKVVKELNTLDSTGRMLKQCSKRSTKRKTNYREASSDEEPKFIASSRSRPNNRATKPDVKKNAEQGGNVSKDTTTIKTEFNDSEIKMELIDPKIEKDPEIQKNAGVECKNENLEIKTEIQTEIKAENDMEINIVPPSEEAVKMECDQANETKIIEEIKIEFDTEVKAGSQQINEENNEGIKIEIKEETKENSGPSVNLLHKPAPLRKRKPRRIRHSTMAAAAAARNKALLHPLTRQEQVVMNQLMESKEPFLQNIPCLKLSAKISKCRECRCASLRSDSMFCRFYDFRRLRFKDKGVLVVDGFSDPNKDPGPNDIEIWMLGPTPRDIDLDISRFILMHVGDQFCRIWQDELSAVEEHMSPNKTIAWKKVVKGVREICDVCETTLFNFHWTCNKCGFGVCLDCYRDRKNKKSQKANRPVRGLDDYGWLVCSLREPHEMLKLMLTQIIPGNALNFLANRLHQACKLWKIPQKCDCPLSVSIQSEQFAPSCLELADKIVKESYLRFYSRECEIKYLNKIKNLDPENSSDCFSFVEAESELIEEAKAAGTLPTILATTLKHLKLLPFSHSKSESSDLLQDVVTKEYNCVQVQKRTQKSLPQKVMTVRSSREMFPGIAHDWLCNGKLLRLLDSRDPRNALLFQEAWKRGQPIMVSELCKFLNIKLWHPEAFCADFGEKKNDLINCMTGNLVPNQPMKLFWEGFQCVSKRLLDSNGQPMLLKLKDWPPGDDFAEILPTRFKDLMSALPLPEYTLRTGGLNIASRLPTIFVPPDLGPKMYNAYGSALHPDKGTTNLHLDISDAVNIMVYVGIPTDASAPEQIRAALSAIDSGGCDLLTRQRVRQPGVMPGALWHIYSARDADKIRDLLNRVTIERGYRLEPDHDPIHDQNWYLDNELRERLYDDYGVEGYPIAQCLGDAVFIPAGAPHQVRNLHNCIKVAEDFVSPENIQHCFHLSQQFRKLSMSHTNHEDKLQIRNVIYHSIKDTTSYLTYLLNQKM